MHGAKNTAARLSVQNTRQEVLKIKRIDRATVAHQAIKSYEERLFLKRPTLVPFLLCRAVLVTIPLSEQIKMFFFKSVIAFEDTLIQRLIDIDFSGMYVEDKIQDILENGLLTAVIESVREQIFFKFFYDIAFDRS